MIPELLYLALDFYRDPRRFDSLRNPNSPLPPGVTELLAAPANCLNEENIAATATRLGASESDCQACVPIFIKQVLLEPSGDYYRTLGLNRDAEQSQVKEHYFYLMRLFHPDKDVSDEGWDDLFAPRINEAYNTLRNAGKRAEYDTSLASADKFDPGQLANSGAAGFVPPAGKGAVPVKAASSQVPVFLRSPWLYGGLVVALIVLLFGLLSSSNDAPELLVTEPAMDKAPAEPGGYRSLDELRAGFQDETKPEIDIEPVEPKTRPVYAQEATVADRRIEDMVAARVAQATTAVLGAPRPQKSAPAPEPKPRSVPKPAPASEESKYQTEVAQRPQPREEPAPKPVSARKESKPQSEVSQRAQAEEEPLRQGKTEPLRDTGPAKMEEPTPVVPVQAVPEPLQPEAQEPAIAPQVLKDRQLMALLGDFAAHYRAGDARAFAGLFTEDARTTDAIGRAAIENLYSEFFAANRVDSVNFRNVSWDPTAGKVRTGRSVVYIATAPHGGGEGSLVEAAISFEIRLGADGKARIARMSY